MKSREHSVGQTQAVGFEVGVRKTFPIPVEQAWALLTSKEGLNVWVGNVERMVLEPGQYYRTADGLEGEVRVVNPLVNVRLTWKLPKWAEPSTVQVRTIPSGQNTILSFHQEKLVGATAREAMHAHWQRVLRALEALIHA